MAPENACEGWILPENACDVWILPENAAAAICLTMRYTALRTAVS